MFYGHNSSVIKIQEQIVNVVIKTLKPYNDDFVEPWI